MVSQKWLIIFVPSKSHQAASTSKSIPGAMATSVAPEARTVPYTTTSLAVSPAKFCEKGCGVSVTRVWTNWPRLLSRRSPSADPSAFGGSFLVGRLRTFPSAKVFIRSVWPFHEIPRKSLLPPVPGQTGTRARSPNASPRRGKHKPVSISASLS